MSSSSPIFVNRDHEKSGDKTAEDIRPSSKSPAETDDSTSKKPGFTYNVLIIMAIKNSPDKKLTLQGIYTYIMDNYTYYRTTTFNWRNSIRHNLSIQKWFVRVSRDIDDQGLGCYWMLDDNYDDEMLLDRKGRCRASRAKKLSEKATTKLCGVSQILESLGVVAPATPFRVDSPRCVEPHDVVIPATPLGLDAPTNPLGVNAPSMLPSYLPPTPMPPYTPNPFFGVGAPVPFIATPMMMPPTHLDFQVFMQWAQKQLQQQWLRTQQIGNGALFKKLNKSHNIF